MKAFFILIRIITVGLVWSIFFLEGVRVIMLKNWRFDIIKPEHWQYAKDLWLSGWVISDAKEWAFVLILLTFIPLWLTGWAALSMVSYSKLLFSSFSLPLKVVKGVLSSKTKAVKDKLATRTVVRKKSHKQVRPPARDGSPSQRSVMDSRDLPTSRRSNTQPKAAIPAPVSSVAPVPSKSSNFEHSLFDFDEEDDDFNFDLDAPVEKKKENPKKEHHAEKSRQDKERQSPKKTKDHKSKVKFNDESPYTKETSRGTNSIFEAIKQKGYELISSITIKNTLIDFIGISQDKIILFLVDKEHGDWLADEEKFNGEEPLWFSENSHRISPVRKIDLARSAIAEKLDNAGFQQDIEAYVVNQMNNIINAEDMAETWRDLNVNVARIDRGTPKELPLLSKLLPQSDDSASKQDVDKIKKLIKGIA